MAFTPSPAIQAILAKSSGSSGSVPSSSSGSDIQSILAKSTGAIPAPAPVSTGGAGGDTPPPSFASAMGSAVTSPVAPATPNEDPLTAGLKTAANLPTSATKFAGNMGELLSGITAIKNVSQIPGQFSALVKQSGGILPALTNTLKAAPEAAYQTLMPKFLQEILSGNIDAARQSIENDPVGQIAPLLLSARGIADSAGVGDQFDSAMSKISSTITKPIKAVVETPTSAMLGLTTGVGPEGIKSAFGGSPEFTSAMRGKTTPEDIVTMAQDLFSKLKSTRASDYQKSLAGIKNIKGSIDISPINSALKTQLENFGVGVTKDGLDFSRSAIGDSSEAGKIQQIYNDVQDWGKKPGDRTAIGLDTLKRRVDNYYSANSDVRSFVTAVRGAVKDTITSQVPEYEKMTKGYSDATNVLNDIKSATSLGSKAGYDAVFTKITRALRTDGGFKNEMINELEQRTGGNIKDYISGANMKSLIPAGIAGKLGDIGATFALFKGLFSPQDVAMLTVTSPRIVGEFLRGLGATANVVSKISQSLRAFNKLTPAEQTSLGVSTQATAPSPSQQDQSIAK